MNLDFKPKIHLKQTSRNKKGHISDAPLDIKNKSSRII